MTPQTEQELRHFGYCHDLAWIGRKLETLTNNLEGFNAGERRERGKTTTITIPKTAQAEDLRKVLTEPLSKSRYRFMIAESGGVDIARQLAAVLFGSFFLEFRRRRQKDPAAAPPKWVMIDNNLNQELPSYCSALFLDSFSFNSTSARGDKVRGFLDNNRVPTFLICSGADPYKMICERLNASFDAYAFVTTHLARSL